MATVPSFEDLPYINGEDSVKWNNLMARYQHQGCPGIDYEDICMNEHGAGECAAKGTCKYAYNKRRSPQ
jgi:hypothetical protein